MSDRSNTYIFCLASPLSLLSLYPLSSAYDLVVMIFTTDIRSNAHVQIRSIVQPGCWPCFTCPQICIFSNNIYSILLKERSLFLSNRHLFRCYLLTCKNIRLCMAWLLTVLSLQPSNLPCIHSQRFATISLLLVLFFPGPYDL